jgi:hypothetical protein
MPCTNAALDRTLKKTLGFLLVGILGSWFGSLGVAAHYFPRSDDWRYPVISQLLSPRDNPAWYWVPSLGIAVSGCLLCPLIRELYRRVRAVDSRPRAPHVV